MQYKTLILQDRLDEILRLLKQIPDKGLIVELGVFNGGSLKMIADTLPHRQVFGFDTFAGLPAEHWNEKEIHSPGELAAPIEEVTEYLKDNDNVTLIKGLFPESAIPFKYKSFAFVHVDFDFYEGIKTAIDFFYPRLVDGGIMVFDDYTWQNCPGVKRALDDSGLEYAPTNGVGQAYLRKTVSKERYVFLETTQPSHPPDN